MGEAVLEEVVGYGVYGVLFIAFVVSTCHFLVFTFHFSQHRYH